LQILQQRQRDNERVQIALASVRRRLGQLQEASDILDRHLAEHPHDVGALLERGRIALDQQRPVQGLAWLRRAQQLAPRVPEVNLVLSRCLHEAGMREEAKLYQDRFLQLEADLEKARAQKKQPGGP
jgi:tetratricopeptide (TPR) repeat protein